LVKRCKPVISLLPKKQRKASWLRVVDMAVVFVETTVMLTTNQRNLAQQQLPVF
jgi:hypothetical protein